MEMTEKTMLIVGIERVIGEGDIKNITIDESGSELPIEMMLKFCSKIMEATGIKPKPILLPRLNMKNFKTPSLYDESGRVVLPTDMEPVTPDKICPGDLIVVSPKKGVIQSSACLNLVHDVRHNDNGAFNIITVAYQRQDGDGIYVYSKPYPIYVKENTFAVLPKSMRDEFITKCLEEHPELQYNTTLDRFNMRFDPKEGDIFYLVKHDGEIVEYIKTNVMGKTSYAFRFTDKEAAKKASSAIKDKIRDISQTLYFKYDDKGTI